MRLFKISDYELPRLNEVDWCETRYAVGIFLATYKTSRERMGYSAAPHLSQSGQLQEIVKSEDETILTVTVEEYQNAEECFRHGFSAIMHPYRPDITERRRKIFFYRLIYGMPIPLVSDRINYQKNVIVNETKMAIIQFSLAIDLLVLK